METRDRILAAALRLFAQRGYEAVGVQEIAEAALTTKPPLYHHFGSKQGLLEALVAGHDDEWLRALAGVATYHGDLPVTLFQVAQAFFGFASTAPDFYRLQIAMWFSPPETVPHQVVSPYLKRQHDVLSHLFEAAVHDHGNLRNYHQAFAISFTGIVNGYITSIQSVGRPLTDAVAREAVKQFMYGIYAL